MNDSDVKEKTSQNSPPKGQPGKLVDKPYEIEDIEA